MTPDCSWSGLLAEEVARWADELDRLELAGIDPQQRTAWAVELLGMRRLLARLRDLADDLESLIARSLGEHETVEVDGRVWARARDVRRRHWDIDGLVRAVLDSRLVDRSTGEVVDETPADKLRHVWRLDGSSVRLGALRARGIDDDEFCAREYGRWRLRDVT